MKIKHFAGYGTVEMKKILERKYTKYGKPYWRVDILVSGDHECGINRSNDVYTCIHWLLNKVRKFKDISPCSNLVEVFYLDVSDSVEKGVYTFMVYSDICQRD